jgi:osmotically-inducible protein OsmY
MAGLMRKALLTATAGAAGAAVAYFLDPDRGRARRARARDQAAAAVRRRKEDAERQARYARGQAEGVAARAEGGGRPQPEDDGDVVQSVRQALAGLEVRVDDVTVEVVDGVVTLRGQVPDEQAKSAVERATGGAAGVREVQSWLHLPDEPAPNKASALGAS